MIKNDIEYIAFIYDKNNKERWYIDDDEYKFIPVYRNKDYEIDSNANILNLNVYQRFVLGREIKLEPI